MEHKLADLQGRENKTSKQATSAASKHGRRVLIWNQGAATDAAGDVAVALERLVVDFRPLVHTDKKLKHADMQECLWHFFERLEGLSKQAEETFSLVLNERLVSEKETEKEPGSWSCQGACS